MNLFFYISLFVFGMLFGSFASVIIHRLYSKEGGILNGRSHCFKCKKRLKAVDLVPIFSYLSTFGKCRYCKKKIPKIYPLLEISTGILFLLIGVFLIDFNLIIYGNLFEIFKLFYWLAIGFITILYVFYDILFMEIDDSIMLCGIILAFLGLIVNTFGFPLLNTISVLPPNNSFVGISSFFVGIIVISSLYFIMFGELKNIYDIGILTTNALILIFFTNYFLIYNLTDIPIISGIIGALGIFIFFYLQILLSNGKALGGGDLRIGIMIGLMLGISYSITGIMLTYLVGSVISVLIILVKKFKHKKINTKIAFGPFMAIGFFLTVFFQNDISKIIEIYF